MAAPSPTDRDYEHLVVVADADRARCQAVRERLESVPAHDRQARGSPRRARYRVRMAHDCDEVARIVSPDVSALVCDLETSRGNGVKVIERLRPSRPDLAILCYTTTPRAEAVAAMMAGADHCVEYDEGDVIVRALELALDRRWLSQLIERSAADLEEARRRLERLDPGTSVLLPGLRPPVTANAVMPFQEAARRYLAACARLFEGDPRGLAERLGMSYFALRRLLRRYDVPFPGRTQGVRSKPGGDRDR